MDRLDAIAALIEDTGLEVVVLNEVDCASFWSGHTNQARYIAKKAGFPDVVEQSNVDVAVPFARISFGKAILSKQAMVDMVRGHSAVPQPERHVAAMAERRRKDFHFEFTTLRFRPIAEYGQWAGRTDFVR